MTAVSLLFLPLMLAPPTAEPAETAMPAADAAQQEAALARTELPRPELGLAIALAVEVSERALALAIADMPVPGAGPVAETAPPEAALVEAEPAEQEFGPALSLLGAISEQELALAIAGLPEAKSGLAAAQPEPDALPVLELTTEVSERELALAMADRPEAKLGPIAASSLAETELPATPAGTVAAPAAAEAPRQEIAPEASDHAEPGAAAAPADDRPVMQPPGVDPAPPEVDPGVLNGRRRPGFEGALPERAVQNNVDAVRAPPPEAFPTDQLPLPDRWRILTSLCPKKGGDQSLYSVFGNMREVCHSELNPYHQNRLKGDIPLGEGRPGFLKEDDWFLNLGLVSDTVLEPRTFPIPVGVQTTARPQSLDVFGKDASFVFSQTFIASASLIKGQTAFMPPHVEYRIALAFNYNHVRVPERRVLYVEPSKGTRRSDNFLGVQEAFIDYHIRNTSDRFDFDSIRVGIQPFQADFRGFLFNDNQLGIRLFGNRDNNRFQYNLAAFWRIEKDTNSGLNNLTDQVRDDFVFIANVYRQDFLIPSLTSQLTVVYNRNREADDIRIDDNGFPVRPALLGNLRGRDYDVFYLGYNADGHIGRLNLTASVYGAFGEDRNSFFTGNNADIRAFFAAAELSYDHDWMRFRLSGLYASGDGDPYDNKETGFDAIFENPIFAGADTSYWIRQTIPFAGGGRVISISNRNGILNSLRSSKDEGQSNFNNPGTMLLGAGADFDLTPEFRLSANANHLWFQNTATLEALRVEGSIPKSIGWDLSAAAIWRPKSTQNLVFRLSAAALLPGKGFKDLFDNLNGHRNYYSVLANIIVAY